MKKFVSMLLPLCLSLLLFSAVAFAAEAPSLPGGTLTADVVSFASKQTYAVYAAPDSKGIRGANGRARVSTNDWIQVFGTDGDWLLVQYAITDSHFRIGYIDKKALSEDAQISELCLTAIPAVVNYDVVVTDDPLVSQSMLTKLTENTRVTAIGSLGDWTYIEGGEGKSRYRGFVPTECLSGTVSELQEANHAIVGSWKLYAGSSVNAERITFYESGDMTGLATLENGMSSPFSGTWTIEKYDPRRGRYWNESEFELTLSRGNTTEQYGLRICRQAVEEGRYKYALVLSDGTRNSSMVLEGEE